MRQVPPVFVAVFPALQLVLPVLLRAMQTFCCFPHCYALQNLSRCYLLPQDTYRVEPHATDKIRSISSLLFREVLGSFSSTAGIPAFPRTGRSHDATANMHH